MAAEKLIYDPDKNFVLQIRCRDGSWEDYFSIKSQGELDISVSKAKFCKGAGDRPGAFRVVSKFMGTQVVADYRFDD